MLIDELKNMQPIAEDDVHPIWSKVIEKVKRGLVGDNIEPLLLNQEMQSYFFVNSQGDLMRNQIYLIDKFLDDETIVRALTDESEVAFPKVSYKSVLTTHNSIHHLYHLTRYIRKQGIEKVKTADSIVEWGGGYGNFCKVFLKAFDEAENKTYTIIDLPEMCVLQADYLRRTLGSTRVNLLTRDNQNIQRGKVNIVSVSDYKLLDIKADFFVSTWALSESPLKHHKNVIDCSFFGASKILFGFHQCGDHIPFFSESTSIGHALKRHGCKIENVKVISGINYYAFM